MSVPHLKILAFHDADSLHSVTHFFQAFYYRVWWLLPTAFLAGVLECAGWAARFWSSQKPALLKPYIIQWVYGFEDRVGNTAIDRAIQDDGYHHRANASARDKLHHSRKTHPSTRPSV